MLSFVAAKLLNISNLSNLHFCFFLLSWDSSSEMKYLAGTGNEHGCGD